MKEKEKSAQAALEESELKYRKIFDAAQEGILLCEASTGQILDANLFLLDLLNYSLAEILAKKIQDLGISPETLQFPESDGGSLQTLCGHSRPISLKTQKGRELPVEMICIRYPLRDKTVIQCSVRNAASRKLMETSIKKLTEEVQAKTQELDNAHKALKKLDELKSEFVSVVSHELRTPLATMQEFTAIISDEIPGKLTKEQRQYLDIIKDNIERLTRLISSLLDISNLEAGKIELKMTLVDLGDLVTGILATLKSQADEKKIELIMKFSESGIQVCVDPERIAQVFMNLIGNAIRFTQESGRITVEIKKTVTEIECSVNDTGIGIAEEDLPKVFRKFQQFGRIPGSGEKGTGLGLSIAKNIVEMHHGRIWVESKVGEGTKLSFALPQSRAEELFKEYIIHARLELRKHGAKRSLMVVSLFHFEKLKQEFSSEKAKIIFKEIEDMLRNSMQGEGEITLKDTGKAVVVLVSYDEKDSLAVKGKLWQVLGDYLARQDLSHKIILRFGDKYPVEDPGEGGLTGK
ncbi:MAG: PAS domain-containing sensor histidine kinase [Candidatus Omnitrophota bacterium]